jgi:formamidopyrimidine-DNA glycosylase
MSIELPEAQIIAIQMNKELRGKEVESCALANCEKLQKATFVNKKLEDFNQLVGGKIDSVASRGTVIRSDLDNNRNLLLAPEYGGIIRYWMDRGSAPKQAHLKLGFTDGSLLTVQLKGFGLIYMAPDSKLGDVYVYKRDFLGGVSPFDKEFTFDYFSGVLGETNKMLKILFVGKAAVIVGLGNSAFQEIAYAAKVHPKKKSLNLDDSEKRALYAAVKEILDERLREGGKDEFVDSYGKPGRHAPVVGPNMRDKSCPRCGTTIDRVSLAGGPTYFCPTCQKL